MAICLITVDTTDEPDQPISRGRRILNWTLISGIALGWLFVGLGAAGWL